MTTLPQLQSLYTAARASAQRFSSYNFQQYFLRRADARFAAPLASLGGKVDANPSSNASEKLDAAALDEFAKAATAEAAVIDRCATINTMYAGEKLVVEGVSSRHGAA